MDDWFKGNRALAALAVITCLAVVAVFLTQQVPSSGGQTTWARPDSPEDASPSLVSRHPSATPTSALNDGEAPDDALPIGSTVPVRADELPESADFFFYEPTGPLGEPASIRDDGSTSTAPFAAAARPPASAPAAPSSPSPRWPSLGAQSKPDRASVAIYDGQGGQQVRTLPNPFGPQSSHPAFGVLSKRGDWLHVDLPTRPNGSQGWIRVEDVNLFKSDVSVDVDVAANRMIVFDKADVVLDVSVTTGTGETPTPKGNFYVTDFLPNPGGAYGSYAFGLSGHSDVLTDFNNGDGQAAIHGTDRPDLMGRSASHGCVRVTNDVATRLSTILTIGVRVRIH